MTIARTNENDKVVNYVGQEAIHYKANQGSRSLRVVVITANKAKFKEFQSQLGDGYGMDVIQWTPDERLDLANEQVLTDLCVEIMSKQAASPHFILREQASLMNSRDGTDYTNLPVSDVAKLELESVVHTSALTSIKPVWIEVDAGGLSALKTKRLAGFTMREYERRSYGYIKINDGVTGCQHGFGWDGIFVNAATNLTNEAFYNRYGKKSARQHTMSDFIETYLRYKTLQTLKHHKLTLTRPIDFGDDYVSVPEFVRGEKHLSNPFIGDWGIDRLRNAMINQGLFYKAAWSRPVKNYFSPPFSGLPLTEKKDEAEETIFMTHDMLHHLVCDLVCDVPATKESFNVYSAWRMMSEACTLVLADMLYADGLRKNNVDRSCLDKRIYPLFEAIKLAQKIPDPVEMGIEDRIAFIKRLLFANVSYALLGDDSEWRNLLCVDGEISQANIEVLNAYKDHFGKFFIGDNAWTRANFDNMQKHKRALDQWVIDVGSDTFRHAHIPLLSDVCSELRVRSVRLDDYAELVTSLFNHLFETKIGLYLRGEPVAVAANELTQSRAFRRFLIGQSVLFSRYPVPLNLEWIKDHLLARLKDDAPFSSQEQNKIRRELKQYILGIEGLRLMSREEALNAIDCTPVFPPVYISYPKMQKQYGSIENCVRDCIKSYPSEKVAPVSLLFTKALQVSVSADSQTPAGESASLVVKGM